MIVWNKVTRLSQVLAIVLFVGVFAFGMKLGMEKQSQNILGTQSAHASFTCDGGKAVDATFYANIVHVELGSEKYYLRQTISADGARYANADESFIFWNKGQGALIMRGNEMDLSYTNCHV